MKTQIIALEAHDDFISVRDRMSWAKSPRILLVWPKYEDISLRPADLRILQQHAASLGAEMGIITRRGDIKRDARRFGIPVFSSAAAAQREAWQPHRRPARPIVGRKVRDRAEIEALRDAARLPEAEWRSRPAARVGAFLLGVLAVLVLAGVFLPEAAITLKPASQAQSVVLPVTVSQAAEDISLTGSVPAHSITVTLAASQEARIATQSSIPNARARGIARFTNLSATDLAIPKGTIIYSVSPGPVQFATLNDTHLPGNINAVVEVPIVAVQGGANANMPANSVQAIQGSLSLSAAVTNPEPTTGGSDRVTAAPSEADRQRLHDVLFGLLRSQAEDQMRASIGANDVLLESSIQTGQVDETYDPPAGSPGNLLKLSMRAEFHATYVAAADLTRLADATLNAATQPGWGPQPGSTRFAVEGTPVTDATGSMSFNLQVSRTLLHDLDLGRAAVLARGVTPPLAADRILAELPLSSRPEIKLIPSWWPWVPLIPFRITVQAGL